MSIIITHSQRLLALEEDKVRLEQMVARLSSQNTEGGGAGKDHMTITCFYRITCTCVSYCLYDNRLTRDY